MKILNKDDIRQEFFRLTKRQHISVDTAIDRLYEKISSDDYLLNECNGVYVYMGSYKLEHECPEAWYPVNEVLVSENDPLAEYKLFYELDRGLSRAVRTQEDLEVIEQNNTIVHIPNVRSYEDRKTFEKDFAKLRKLYLKALCLSNEESAVALVTSEDYIKGVFSVENYMKENNISPVFYQSFYDAACCNKKESATSKAKRI